jgi:hypothetical protein
MTLPHKHISGLPTHKLRNLETCVKEVAHHTAETETHTIYQSISMAKTTLSAALDIDFIWPISFAISDRFAYH